MIKPRTTYFLLSAILFAVVHWFAVKTSLYWVYWWFDIVMHFWGGALITYGTYVIYSFVFENVKPHLKIILLMLVVTTGAWEVFEWFAGLYDPATYLIDTIKDVIVGFSGGLFTYGIFRRYKIN